MSHWFDARAATSTLTPDQKRKVALIKAALQKSDKELHVLVYGISLAEDSAAHFGPQPSFGGHLFAPITVKFRAQLAAELRSASTRLAALHTGLLAEKQLRSSLLASAAGADAWYRALSSDDGATIFREQRAMTAAFAKADKLQKAGLANLEKGR